MPSLLEEEWSEPLLVEEELQYIMSSLVEEEWCSVTLQVEVE